MLVAKKQYFTLGPIIIIPHTQTKWMITDGVLNDEYVREEKMLTFQINNNKIIW